MDQTGIIMAVFFTAATTYTIFEDQQHSVAASRPMPTVQITKITQLGSTSPDDAYNEMCCDKVLQRNTAESIGELKNAIKIEEQEINRLKQVQREYEQQLSTVYQQNHMVKNIENKYREQTHFLKSVAASRAVDYGLTMWAVHEKEINHLAMKNGHLRFQYLPETEQEGYKLNILMNDARKKQDHQRAAINARIAYLNELYRHQHQYLSSRVNAGTYKLAVYE